MPCHSALVTMRRAAIKWTPLQGLAAELSCIQHSDACGGATVNVELNSWKREEKSENDVRMWKLATESKFIMYWLNLSASWTILFIAKWGIAALWSTASPCTGVHLVRHTPLRDQTWVRRHQGFLICFLF